MTKEEAIKLHRELWNRIAADPGHLNDWYLVDMLDERRIEYIPRNNCFLCEYAKIVTNRNGDFRDFNCENCPVSWGERADQTSCPCSCFETPFKKYWRERKEGNYKRLAELAREVANLPEK